MNSYRSPEQMLADMGAVIERYEPGDAVPLSVAADTAGHGACRVVRLAGDTTPSIPRQRRTVSVP